MTAPGRYVVSRDGGRGSASGQAALRHIGRAVASIGPESAHRNSNTATSPEELARLLGGVRAALGYSEIELAMRLGTAPRVVFALENGWLEALPPRAETRRVVEAWVAAAGLDPRPALEALGQAMRATGGPGCEPAEARLPGHGGTSRQGLVHRPGTASNPAAIAARSTVDEAELAAAAPQPPGFARLLRLELPASRWVRLAALAVAAAGLWTATTQTAVVAAAVATLPAPAERAVRSISDFIAVRFAPQREGHRWISVDDPRTRRGDKLRIGRRSD